MAKEVTDKPEWFCSSKYQPFRDMNAAEWSHQLKQRAIALDPLLKVDGAGERIFSEIVSNPIVPERRKTVRGPAGFFQLFNRAPDSKKEYFELFQDFVAPLSCADILWRNQDLNDDVKVSFHQSEEDRELTSLPIDYYDHRKGFNSTGIISLNIDLNGPDESIIRDFEKHLLSARKLYGYPESEGLKGSILSRLFDTGVVQYLDLRIWMEQKGLKIPNHILGDWIFTDDLIDVSEKVRKVTKPLARRSLQASFINALVALKDE